MFWVDQIIEEMIVPSDMASNNGGSILAKVLLVDDEPDILFLFSKILTDQGYIVFTAPNGSDALEIIKMEKPDLVLLDVMMPKIDGWELCKTIRDDEEIKKTLVAMFTVKSIDEDYLRSFDEATADWHIAKPIDTGKFLRMVDWLINSPK